MTFKCVTHVLDSTSCGWFVLENVDIDDESKNSNLSLILQALQNSGPSGFNVRCFKVVSTDFGLPQRRVRLYFVGVSCAIYPNVNMDNVSKHLNLFKLKTQPPVLQQHLPNTEYC